MSFDRLNLASAQKNDSPSHFFDDCYAGLSKFVKHNAPELTIAGIGIAAMALLPEVKSLKTFYHVGTDAERALAERSLAGEIVSHFPGRSEAMLVERGKATVESLLLQMEQWRHNFPSYLFGAVTDGERLVAVRVPPGILPFKASLLQRAGENTWRSLIEPSEVLRADVKLVRNGELPELHVNLPTTPWHNLDYVFTGDQKMRLTDRVSGVQIEKLLPVGAPLMTNDGQGTIYRAAYTNIFHKLRLSYSPVLLERSINGGDFEQLPISKVIDGAITPGFTLTHEGGIIEYAKWREGVIPISFRSIDGRHYEEDFALRMANSRYFDPLKRLAT